MTGYAAIPDSDIDPESPGNVSLFTRLRDNPIAMFEKASGAPVLANGYVTQAMMGAGSVGQAQLKTATGNVSTSNTDNSSPTTSITVLPGGQYGFWPQFRATAYDSAAGAASFTWKISIEDFQSVDSTYDTGDITRIYLEATGRDTKSVTATQRYVTASRPYNLGDGEVGHFIFAVMNANGRPESIYAAPEAPWHLNGPTDIRAEFYDAQGRGWRHEKRRQWDWRVTDDGAEIPILVDVRTELVEVTQEIKQRDMALIPHPFIGNNLTGKTVVLIDPASDLVWTLAEMSEEGVSINTLLHDDHLRIDNNSLKRIGPAGVMVVGCKWKLT